MFNVNKIFDKLFPICRSITGEGYRQSFDIIKKFIPFKKYKYPSGKKVFDWKVPNEWNIKEAYIENFVGYNNDQYGSMYFQRTLEDWASFNINDRTKFDASISSGLAIMANQKHLYTPTKPKSKISVNFARYNNKSSLSQLIK